jgi:hypothetical protein
MDGILVMSTKMYISRSVIIILFIDGTAVFLPPALGKWSQYHLTQIGNFT